MWVETIGLTSQKHHVNNKTTDKSKNIYYKPVTIQIKSIVIDANSYDDYNIGSVITY